MVKVHVNEQEGRVLALQIEMGQEKVEQEYESVAEQFHRVVQLPGFRRGKAPSTLVKERFHEQIMKRVVENLICRGYQEALQKEGIEANFLLSVNKVQLEEGLKFVAKVELPPTVSIPKYKGLELERKKIKVDVEDIVEKRLNFLRKELAKFVPKEGVVQVGDVVECKVAGGKKFSLYIKGEGFLEEQLIGAKKGEWRLIKLENKEVMQVQILRIMNMVLPELDDEFAQRLGDYKDLSHLKEKVRRQVEEELRMSEEQSLREQAISKLLDEATFQIPSTLIARRVQRILINRLSQLERAGVSLQDYLKERGMSKEQMMKEVEKEAERGVKERTLLLAIADAEGIKVEEEEIEEVLCKLAERFGRKKEEFEQQIGEEGLQHLVERERMRKALEKIISFAIVKEGD
jgi:trigger factor